ncbi:MAG: AAA-like domain-containing protein [Bacteroidia bacterium]|nr:AAA-like domain-containing protein [Bacteroidia bacterium]
MTKEFNITGTCIPDMHYMVDTSDKLDKIIELIDRGKYFTINRPRQFGKTTTMYLLSKKLEKMDDYLVIRLSFEGIGDIIFENENKFSREFIEIIANKLKTKNQNLSKYLTGQIEKINNLNDVSNVITEFIIKTGRKIVLMIDEVDKSSNNQLFLSFLGVLRNKYLLRNEGEDHTFHSVILAGVHDVKTLKLKYRPDGEQKPFDISTSSMQRYAQDRYNSSWNIAVDFKVDMSFNPAEIATMLEDYSNDKKIIMDIPEISKRIHHYTSGYPFLVSRICKEIDEKIATDGKDNSWTIADVDDAVKTIILEVNTNFESLVKHVEENLTLKEYVENIILGNKSYSYNALNLTINIGVNHGIFSNENQKIAISNKIYEEVLTNYITSKLEHKEEIINNIVQSSYIKPNRRLDIEKVLSKFQEVIKEKYSKSDLLKSSEFLEKDLRLLFLVFLKPIINGIGFSFKEVETSEEKRLDIIVIFRDEKFVVELKLWRSEEYHKQGITRLKDYMRREGVQKGFMLIMDKRRNKEFAIYEEDGLTMVWI